MFWKIMWALLAISNGISMTAVVFFGFVPTPHQIAAAAFFGAGAGCIAMFNQN